jgi:hypothetical protein
MVTRKHASKLWTKRDPMKRVPTLYEAELLRRHPDIEPEVLAAWSEGR